jgi:hypothetical protein
MHDKLKILEGWLVVSSFSSPGGVSDEESAWRTTHIEFQEQQTKI